MVCGSSCAAIPPRKIRIRIDGRCRRPAGEASTAKGGKVGVETTVKKGEKRAIRNTGRRPVRKFSLLPSKFISLHPDDPEAFPFPTHETLNRVRTVRSPSPHPLFFHPMSPGSYRRDLTRRGKEQSAGASLLRNTALGARLMERVAGVARKERHQSKQQSDRQGKTRVTINNDGDDERNEEYMGTEYELPGTDITDHIDAQTSPCLFQTAPLRDQYGKLSLVMHTWIGGAHVNENTVRAGPDSHEHAAPLATKLPLR
ncbi:hypothetical protein C8J57DRAFT_1240224 [Mycena rebaudengoi]|nr:hypothetical protein C8J57DRAFT_1240224 [Mycena rebaudengoi]